MRHFEISYRACYCNAKEDTVNTAIEAFQQTPKLHCHLHEHSRREMDQRRPTYNVRQRDRRRLWRPKNILHRSAIFTIQQQQAELPRLSDALPNVAVRTRKHPGRLEPQSSPRESDVHATDQGMIARQKRGATLGLAARGSVGGEEAAEETEAPAPERGG